jgi:hypothetical protein
VQLEPHSQQHHHQTAAAAGRGEHVSSCSGSPSTKPPRLN